MSTRIGTVSSLRLLGGFRKDPILLMDRLRREKGDLVELSVGPSRILFCFHPDHAEHVLKTGAANYRKSRIVFDKILPLTGRRGLVQLEGEEGRAHRQVTGASLSMEAISEAFPLLVRTTRETGEDLAALHGKTIDIAAVMTNLVLRNALILVFGQDLAGATREMAEAFVEANTLCGRRIRGLVPIPESLPTPGARKLKNAIRVLNHQIEVLINDRFARRDERSDAKDLLSILVRKNLGREQIRDHLATFLFAGHETTATSLAWTLYLLGRNELRAREIREECAAFSRAPTLEGLRDLDHTLNAYQEALRLFPPAWTLAREAVAEDMIGGHRVRKGSLILLGVGQIQRHGDFWENADHFIPSRFVRTAESAARHPYAYLPFGGGSRICIGMRTAMIEAALILAILSPKLRFHIPPGFKPEMEAMITAHPRAGVPARVERL